MLGSTLLAVLASTILSIGLYLMKRRADVLPALGIGLRPIAWWAFVRDPLWLWGVALQVVGYGLYLVALRGASLSVVHAALDGGIALFVVLAVVGLGETVEQREWFGVVIVVVGLLALSLSLDVDSGGDRLAGRSAVFSLVVVGAAIVGMAVDRVPGRPIGLCIASGLFLGLAGIFAKGLAAAPSFGESLRGSDLWLTLATNLVGFVLMQAALQTGRSVVAVPIFSTLSNLVPIAGGIFVYGESLLGDGPLGFLRPIAFVMALGGAAILAGFPERQRS